MHFTFAAFFASTMLVPWAFIFLLIFFMYFLTELIWSIRALSVRSVGRFIKSETFINSYWSVASVPMYTKMRCISLLVMFFLTSCFFMLSHVHPGPHV